MPVVSLAEGAVTDFEMSREEAIQIAFRITSSPAEELPDIFYRLRRRRRLWATVHQFNTMLKEPTHRTLALLALKRMGLEDGG